MDDLTDLLRQLLGEKSILDEATEMNAATRERVAALLSRGTTRTIFSPDGQIELGKVVLTNPKPTTRVVDMAALIEWVEANHPGALVHTVSISPAWLKGLLAKGADDDGEVPPGVVEVTGTPSLQVRPSDDARALARGLVRKALE